MAKSKKFNDADERKARDEYIMRIKKALKAAKKEADSREKQEVSMQQLANRLFNTYYLSIDYRTLGRLFDENDHTEPNFFCLVTVCKYYGFDLDKLLKLQKVTKNKLTYQDCAEYRYRAFADEDIKNEDGEFYADIPFQESMANTRQNFVTLQDKGYVGTFHGYRADEENAEPTVFTFTLNMTMDKNDGYIRAELITHLERSESTGETEIDKSYQGIPVRSRTTDIILLFLVNDNTGDFIQMSFPYDQYEINKLKLIYRYGEMQIGKGAKKGEICTQNFWLFNTPLSEEKYKYLRGMLRVPNHSFFIPVQDVTDLAEKDDDVKYFLDQYGRRLESECKSVVYEINENAYTSGNNKKINKMNVVKALLQLKEKSLLQTAFHYRIRHKRYNKFVINDIAGTKFKPGKK